MTSIMLPKPDPVPAERHPKRELGLGSITFAEVLGVEHWRCLTSRPLAHWQALLQSDLLPLNDLFCANQGSC